MTFKIMHFCCNLVHSTRSFSSLNENCYILCLIRLHHYAYTDHFYVLETKETSRFTSGRYKQCSNSYIYMQFFNNMLPSTFHKFFLLNKELHEYNTRGSEKIHMRHGQTNYKKYTTRNKGCHILNKLPIEMLQSKTLQIFRNKVKKYYLNTMDVEI